MNKNKNIRLVEKLLSVSQEFFKKPLKKLKNPKIHPKRNSLRLLKKHNNHNLLSSSKAIPCWKKFK